MRTLVAFLLLCSAAFGQTYWTNLNINSGANVVLTKAGSPHIFSGQINVYQGNLTIEPGAEIVFTRQGSAINLWYGALSNLTALGTIDSPILIRSNGPKIKGIQVVSSTTRSVIKMQNVTYTNLGYGSLLFDLRNANVQMQSCLLEIIRPATDTASVTALDCGTAIGMILDCEIRNATIGLNYYQSQVFVDQIDIKNCPTPIQAANRNVTVSLLGL